MNKKWSKKYDRCQKCGTTGSPHAGHGLCRKCHEIWYYNNPKGNKIKQKVAKKYHSSEKGKLVFRNATKKWRLLHQEEIRIYSKEYNQRPEIKKNNIIKTNIRRARKKSVDFWSEEMSERWEWIIDATEGYCPCCGEPFDNGKHKLTMDHIIPLTPKSGDPQGIHHIDNVQVLCKSCNSSKHNRLEPK